MPQYTACLASSLDGKIAPASTGAYVRMGSDEDIAHLMRVRDGFDALVMGGATFRAYPKRHQCKNAEHRLLHAIISRGEELLEDLPPELPLFQDETVPLVIFIGTLPDVSLRGTYSKHLEWLEIGLEPEIQMKRIDEFFKGKGCERVLVEGGGHIMAMFLEAKKLKDMYLTLCPLFLGGSKASNLFNGAGFSVEKAPKTRILDLKQLENEIYLHLAFDYC